MDDISITISAATNRILIRTVNAFVRELLSQLKPFSEDTKMLNMLELVVNEAVVNVFRHAYKADETKKAQIQIDIRGEQLEFRFADWGESFNLEEVPQPNLDEPAVGGLGIWLLREIMDEVTYNSAPDGKNVLTLIKRVPGIELVEDLI